MENKLKRKGADLEEEEEVPEKDGFDFTKRLNDVILNSLLLFLSIFLFNVF